MVIFGVLVVCASFGAALAQTEKGDTWKRTLGDFQSAQVEMRKQLQELAATCDSLQTVQTADRVVSNGKMRATNALLSLVQSDVENRTVALRRSVDSLNVVCDTLQKTQVADRAAIDGKMREVSDRQVATESVVADRTLWGVAISSVILLSLSLLAYILTRRIRCGASSIDEIRKAQDALQKAQVKIQEEAVNLYNKMVELCEQQICTAPAKEGAMHTYHSLVLKVADEIVRIEMNLMRMDASIKGYKQLQKAVQRIKDNFNANGYEIVDMLGKPYDVGLKAAVAFVTDESLEPGQQVITKVIKPQINYQQQMIQAAQIEVSQSE